jgi:hypothetical protein
MENSTDIPQWKIDELKAIVEGLEIHISALEQTVLQWRETTNRTVLLLSQREAEDDKQRRERTAHLDRELLLLRIGAICNGVLMLVLISLYIGSKL